MDDLVKRLEAASEGSRELDLAVHRARMGHALRGASELEHFRAAFPTNEDLPHYTESLDAALTLYKDRPERIPAEPLAACWEALRQWS